MKKKLKNSRQTFFFLQCRASVNCKIFFALWAPPTGTIKKCYLGLPNQKLSLCIMR